MFKLFPVPATIQPSQKAAKDDEADEILKQFENVHVETSPEKPVEGRRRGGGFETGFWRGKLF